MFQHVLGSNIIFDKNGSAYRWPLNISMEIKIGKKPYRFVVVVDDDVVS